jgi:hypothetical protein
MWNLGLTGFMDTRTPDDFKAEVDEYLDRARPLLGTRAIANAVRLERGRLALDVSNLGEENYAAVEVELTIPGPFVSAFETSDLEDVEMWFPDAPRPWGTSMSLAHLSVTTRALASMQATPPAFRGATRNSDAGTTITFAPEDVRPNRRAVLWSVFVLATAPVDETSVVARWTATSTSSSGQTTGELSIPIADGVVALEDLIQADGEPPGDE